MTSSAYIDPSDYTDGLHALRTLLNDLRSGPVLSTAATRPAEPGRHAVTNETTRLILPITEFPAPPGDDPKPPDAPSAGTKAAEIWELVERAQAGEAEAFGQIYDLYVDTVYRFIFFRVRNTTLAEDLTSDTFLRAMKRITSFTWQGKDIGAWFITIARNLVADYYKSGRYRFEVVTPAILDGDRAANDYASDPAATAAERVDNAVLYAAVQQLGPEQKECVILRFFHGFDVTQTARAMGKNVGAIKAMQYRALRNLERIIPKEAIA